MGQISSYPTATPSNDTDDVALGNKDTGGGVVQTRRYRWSAVGDYVVKTREYTVSGTGGHPAATVEDWLGELFVGLDAVTTTANDSAAQINDLSGSAILMADDRTLQGNVDYPAAFAFQAWRIVGDTHLGGTNGVDAKSQDLLVCIANNDGGTADDVGTDFIVICGVFHAQALVTAEATARAAAVTAEATARGNADTTLQTNINTEATTRGNADTALAASIVTAQAAAETYTDTSIADLIADGTSLTGLPNASGLLDSDDGVVVLEDGVAKIATGLQMGAQVDAAGAVMNADYNAQSVLAAVTDDTPTVITIAAQQVLGRKTGGNVGALNATDLVGIVKDADGSGSGLDADLLDGLEATGFLKTAPGTTVQTLTSGGANSARITFDPNSLTLGDWLISIYKNGTDTQPIVTWGTVLGLSQQQYGVGGSTAPDASFQRSGVARITAAQQLVVYGGNTSTRGRVPGRIFQTVTPVGNVGTGEDTLTTTTLGTGELATNGDAIVARCNGLIANNANQKRIRLKFGTSNIVDTGAAGIPTGTALSYHAEWWVVRVDATHQEAWGRVVLSNGTTFSAAVQLTETLANALAVFITGETNASSNNDVTSRQMVVSLEGAV